MEINEITGQIISSAIKVHRQLGPGLLESAYEACLTFELRESGIKVEVQKPIPVMYRGIKLDCGYRSDLVVDDLVIVEIKSVDCLTAVHGMQVLSYLRLSKLSVGLLINFNVVILKQGIQRIVNHFRESSALSSAYSAYSAFKKGGE